jgi:C-terminal processing protease CtpA/Prc
MAGRNALKRNEKPVRPPRARRPPERPAPPVSPKPDSQLGAVTSLPTFIGSAAPLTKNERARLVEQALVLIEQLYVHLPLKRAMHAVDPVQRLRLLRFRLDALSERQFHDELICIFTELRDLHTNYILPVPFQLGTAFLPFLIEDFEEKGQRRYMASKLFDGFTPEHFTPGAIITHWNGVPIDRAVQLNADRQAGSNPAARHARGLEAMTIRPLAMSPPPDEEWVDVGFVGVDGTAREIRVPWRVFQADPAPNGVDPTDGSDRLARALGIDVRTEAVRRAKKLLFNRPAVAKERHVARLRAKRGKIAATVGGADASTMPDVFSFRTVTTAHGTFGYVRIWTFSVNSPDEFIGEFIRILGLLPQNGLIVDVRGNGGGLIPAGEQLLQLFTPKTITPESLHFINTPLTLRLVTGDAELGPWRESIARSVEVGTQFSSGFPIDSVEACNAIGQRYVGPVVLITDALVYSTTDIFAAGFQDHEIGPIIGTSGNTGAGGANVWELGLLRDLFPGSDWPFRDMPKGASFRVAIRRTTRVNTRAGVPLEDLGVVPDEVHAMTRDDLLNGNRDLIELAASRLAARPLHALSGEVKRTAGKLKVTATTKNVDRLDVLVDERPRRSEDVHDGTATFEVPASSSTKELRLCGFKDGRLVAALRISA